MDPFKNRFPRNAERAYFALCAVSFIGMLILMGTFEDPVLLFRGARNSLSVSKASFLIGWTGLAALIYLVSLTLSVSGSSRLIQSLPPQADIGHAPQKFMDAKNAMLAMFAFTALGILDSFCVCMLLQSRIGDTPHFRLSFGVHGLAGLWTLFLALWSLNRWSKETLCILDPANCFPGSEKEGNFWKMGFYCNRLDPRFIVPGRNGKGKALNLAHAAIYMILIFIIAGTGAMVWMTI